MFVTLTSLDVILRAVILSTLAVFWVIMTVRLVGLRAFSKMTAFDFVVTVATGSLLAGSSQATEWSGFWQGVLAISTLLGVQWAVARARLASLTVTRVLQNRPVLLMKDGVIFDDTLSRTRVTRDDLIAKLREANALNFDQVRAVVLETTGNISVLHGAEYDDRLLEGVTDPTRD
ncbi:DUF421 domain-containing protein [Pseudooceanicola sp. MF1-13]|uniref:DUF421 domain-containing protein n=1 Tax=Pseudooceanicola sp. MF1-13 TaxID=3379095 RepID=UPI003892BDE4